MSENSEKNVQICINKMNELADENEELKQTVSDWSGSYDELLFCNGCGNVVLRFS